MNPEIKEKLHLYLPYGLKIEEWWTKTNGGGSKIIGIDYGHKLVTTIDSKNRRYRKSFGDVKPIMYPLSALTETMKEGFVPIDELLKLKYPVYWKHHENDRYGEIVVESSVAYTEAYYWCHANYSIKVTNCFDPHEEYWIYEKMISWGFWLWDQSLFEKGELIDKSKIWHWKKKLKRSRKSACLSRPSTMIIKDMNL